MMEKETKGISTGFAIAIVALIIFFIAVFVYYFWEKANMQRMFDMDCRAVGFNMWGLVDEWECPTS
jgi:hypothetical protein